MSLSKPTITTQPKVTSIDELEIIRELGHGNFGRVYLVQRKANVTQTIGARQNFVLKKVNISSVTDRAIDDEQSESLKKMIFQEAEIMKAFEHPNIVAVYSSFVEGNHFNMVMEYCDCGTMKQAITTRAAEMSQNNGRYCYFNENQICDWLAQIALALQHLHEHNILHRDIKPDNIFLVEGMRKVKLGDFGIARVLDGPVKAAQTTIGTVTHMSPEQLQGMPYGFKSEVWALGVVAYEMTAFRLPFNVRESNFVSMALAISTKQPDPIIPEINVSQALRDLIEKRMLVRDTNERAGMLDVIADISIKRFVQKLQVSDSQKILEEKLEETWQKLIQVEGKLEISERCSRDLELRLKQNETETEEKLAKLKAMLEAQQQLITDLQNKPGEIKSLNVSSTARAVPAFMPTSVSIRERASGTVTAPAHYDKQKLDALFSAAVEGNLGKLKALLEEGKLDVNARDANATDRKQLDASAGKWSYSGATALIFAAGEGHLEIVKLLAGLPYKAQVDAQMSHDGSTALMAAAYFGHKSIVEALVRDFEAKVGLSNAKGKTALTFATERGHYDIVKMLIRDFQADSRVRDKDDCTLLMYAAVSARTEVIRGLVKDFSVATAEKDRNGFTALFYAILKGSVETVKVLVEDCNADINLRGANNNTALMMAVQWDRLEIAKYLLQRGATVNLRNTNGKTALGLATEKGANEIATLLKSFKAIN